MEKIESIIESSTREIDLDEVVTEFNAWHRHHEEVIHKKETLESDVAVLQKQYEASQERCAATLEDFKQTQEMVTKLQDMLKINCNVADENHQLKERVTNLLDELAATKEEHKLAIEEAETKMKKLVSSHVEKMARLEEKAEAQRVSEVGILKSGLQQKMTEICQLQRQLAELEKEKHTELARLRLEYDAKLLKLQKENSRAQQQSTRTTSKGNDIFRQKLLNVRSESDKEISSLKRTISDLQRKLDAKTGGSFPPKRKF